MSESMLCEVCQVNPVICVASSSLGPMSQGYCKTCAENGAEAPWMISFTVASVYGELHESFYEILTYVDGKYVSAKEYLESDAGKLAVERDKKMMEEYDNSEPPSPSTESDDPLPF